MARLCSFRHCFEYFHDINKHKNGRDVKIFITLDSKEFSNVVYETDFFTHVLAVKVSKLDFLHMVHTKRCNPEFEDDIFRFFIIHDMVKT